MKKLLVLALLCAIAFTFVACGNKTGELETVRFTSPKSDWAGLGLIAIEKGYFEKQGLNVEVSYVDTGVQAMQALVSGSVDFASVVDTNVATLGFSGNEEVSIVASTNNYTASAIVARKSSGISTPADLKGKKLAISSGTTSEIYAVRLLEKYGLTLNDVEISKIAAGAIGASLISKAVDAISSWEPWNYNAIKAIGDDAITFREPAVYTGNMFLGVNKEFAKNNKATTVKFLKAMKEAANFAKSNPSEAQATLAGVINLDLEVMQSIWDGLDYDVTFSNEYIDRVTKIGEYYKEDEANKGKVFPDYSKYFDGSFAKEVK